MRVRFFTYNGNENTWSSNAILIVSSDTYGFLFDNEGRMHTNCSSSSRYSYDSTYNYDYATESEGSHDYRIRVCMLKTMDEYWKEINLKAGLNLIKPGEGKEKLLKWLKEKFNTESFKIKVSDGLKIKVINFLERRKAFNADSGYYPKSDKMKTILETLAESKDIKSFGYKSFWHEK